MCGEECEQHAQHGMEHCLHLRFVGATKHKDGARPAARKGEFTEVS